MPFTQCLQVEHFGFHWSMTCREVLFFRSGMKGKELSANGWIQFSTHFKHQRLVEAVLEWRLFIESFKIIMEEFRLIQSLEQGRQLQCIFRLKTHAMRYLWYNNWLIRGGEVRPRGARTISWRIK